MRPVRIAVLVTGLAALAAPAAAQEQPLDEAAVRSFLGEFEQQVETGVRSGDIRTLQQWLQRHLADDAEFWIDATLDMHGSKIANMAIFLDKQQTLELLALTGGLIRGGIADYDFGIEVEEVVVAPDGDSARVRALLEERGVIQSPPETASAAARELPFEAAANCVHRLRREEGRVVLGMTSCEGRSGF